VTIKGKKITDYKLIYIRDIEGIYAQAAILAHIARMYGVSVVDSSLAYDILSADNKVEYAVRSKLNGLPVPHTLYSPSYEELLNISDNIKFPAVLKVVDLHRGQGVFLVNSKEEIRKYFEEKGESGRRDFLLQEKVDYVKDYRIIVVGKKILGAIEHEAHTGEFRANINSESRARSVAKIDPKLASIALKAANMMSLDIAGVDVIEDKFGNYFIIEINRSPKTKEFEELTGIDALEAIFKYFREIIS
ncbi:MAG TPA: ATP-grasp domain-containing protein, partial [Patescibacteria group bacterium]